ncbi:hypothetical protein H6F62_11165 [Anabaena sp. FACHB-1391]|uniref:hypothetical protein n=1 Tax=Anabaena sp. FACHB-1391 TaxID=2692771 RepID=UPI001681B866|nr:hypothetical protein [Anabaena sp. FACHB-1391]MBD2269310.1 hypothetical protein [Anabaena sp. FACHB-1391]
MNIITKIKAKINLLGAIFDKVISIQNKLIKIQETLGRIESRQLQSLDKLELQDNEFQVFSQWGEDGIIQMLLRHIEIPNKIFIEFGVENYTESNTRFLLINDNWAGLVIDGSPENISYIKQDSIYWQRNLKAVQAFIDQDNINKIIAENGIKGEIGILSIDIDGNDYWVWQAIDVVAPAIVIIEYNSIFGKDKAVTIPYDPSFVRSEAHYSMLYAGASLKALYNLGKAKGYSFVGCNSVGNNAFAFFVRQDLKPTAIKELTVAEGYIASQFRESRDEKGNLSYLSWDEGNKILSSLPLVDLE